LQRLEEGIPALYRYQAVKYHHIAVEPGANLILTSDPWSYIYAWISQKKDKTRGHRRACYGRAIYYARLAESFYKAAMLPIFQQKAHYYTMVCWILLSATYQLKEFYWEEI
jgi:hypothetical protein